MKHPPSNNNTFYIEHNKENNTVVLKEDKGQFIKDGIIENLEAIESKLKTKNKTKQNRKELKKLEKIYIVKLRGLAENELADNLE